MIAVARYGESDADSCECPLSGESAPLAGDSSANDSARCSSLLLNYSLRNVASRGVIVGQLYRSARQFSEMLISGFNAVRTSGKCEPVGRERERERMRTVKGQNGN